MILNTSIHQLSKKIIHRHLTKLSHGQLILIEPNKKYIFGKKDQITAEIKIKNIAFYSELLFGGSIGSAESYIQGTWTSKNLTDVIRLMSVNSNVMDGMEGIFKVILRPFFRLIHWLNKNTLYGSKKNIAHHYDLSNEFFAYFLDPLMMYSSAVYSNQAKTLNEAAILKLKTICDRLKLTKKDHVVEIGTGWGGFAVYAAKNYGCKVTTTTISNQQYNHVKNLIKKEKLDHRITLLKKDYRQLKGQFNKLVSIEMIEAVGHHFYKSYFKTIARLLKDDGEALIQAITIKDQRYKQALNSVDFIQKYIFPGSCIPSLQIIQETIHNETDMNVVNIRDITMDYAKTLKHWRENFKKNIIPIKRLGFDEQFIRMWIFYLCYCEGGFKERAINDLHIHFVKPNYRANKIG